MRLLEWLIPWEPSIAVVAASGVAALLFIRGCRTLQLQVRCKILFWFGLLSMYFVAQTQFDYYAEHEFFVHRIQHSVLHHFGPFLIALSRPGAVLWAGTPAVWRNSLEKLSGLQPIPWLAGALNNPIVAVTLFGGLILFWLLPSVHFIAMLDWHLYRVMNWSMAINGLMFWNLVLNSYSIRPAHLSPGCRIAIMLAVIPPQIAIGVLLFFTPRELYPIYRLCGLAFPEVSTLADQQIGGLILWIPGSMMSVIGVLIVIRNEWMRPKHG